MWAVQLIGSLNKVVGQFTTAWGHALAVLNYRQQHGVWKSVSWTSTQVAKTAIVTPVTGGSIEVTDLMFMANKVSSGTVTITFEDGTNTVTLATLILTNEAVRMSHQVQGRMQGWRDAGLYYTVAGANSTGAITIGYVKHGKATSEPYSVWDTRR